MGFAEFIKWVLIGLAAGIGLALANGVIQLIIGLFRGGVPKVGMLYLFGVA
jgi:hypothetical protein